MNLRRCSVTPASPIGCGWSMVKSLSLLDQLFGSVCTVFSPVEVSSSCSIPIGKSTNYNDVAEWSNQTSGSENFTLHPVENHKKESAKLSKIYH